MQCEQYLDAGGQSTLSRPVNGHTFVKRTNFCGVCFTSLFGSRTEKENTYD